MRHDMLLTKSKITTAKTITLMHLKHWGTPLVERRTHVEETYCRTVS